VKRLVIWKVKTRLNHSTGEGLNVTKINDHSIGEGLDVTKKLMTILLERVFNLTKKSMTIPLERALM